MKDDGPRERIGTIYQFAVPSNWFEFSGVMPFVARSLPSGESTLILPDMNG